MLRAATRASALALWQTRHVASLLGRPVDEVVVSTSGDRLADTPIHRIGGKGAFVKEVQAAVIEGRADMAVHSAKDLQAVTPAGLRLAALCSRADPRDALVGSRLEDLGHGARIATGSARRRVQLHALRPDLAFAELRGNIATRLAKAADFDAIVVAAAALDRLGIEPGVVELLDPEAMVPQVGQGALAVECRADDHETIGLLAEIDDPHVRPFVDAERAFLAALGGDCTLPAGAYATATGDGSAMRLLAVLAAPSTAGSSSADSHLGAVGGSDESEIASGKGPDAKSKPNAGQRPAKARESASCGVPDKEGERLLREERVGTDPVWLGQSVAHRLLDAAGAISESGLPASSKP